MLVFVSDIHFTDGTAGETIDPGAFTKFSFYLENMAMAAGAEEIEIVFLGDLFDCIRSEYWLASSLRPWSDEKTVDGTGLTLKNRTIEILGGIINNPENRASLGHLQTFKTAMAARGVKVTYTYIIGNHDWLVNRYPETRMMAAYALGIENPEHYQTGRFMLDCFWEEYRVVARHGDLYDPFNHMGDRDAPSLGDSLVIDLVNQFPRMVSEEIDTDFAPSLIARLKELDNVRQLFDVPLWIRSVCRQLGTIDTEERVKRIWNRTVDRFLSIEFVQKYDKPWQFDLVDQLELCLKISKVLTLEELLRLPLRLLQSTHDSYAEHAFREQAVKDCKAVFTVYGHTHIHAIRPLDKVCMGAHGGEVLDKIYFNSGTWRKVHVRTAHAEQFSGWHVMTFIAFYRGKERGGKKFEVWNGALG
jgi:UDP-2,3-diacylglucosamine pyrophosphatase LpxH